MEDDMAVVQKLAETFGGEDMSGELMLVKIVLRLLPY